jgi:group I intron endonuclease
LEIAVRQNVIYKIINLVNNKFYVGSTTHKKVRFRTHRKMLRGNYHHCKHLQAAWNKYGEDNFVFVVVEVIADVEDLESAEDRWLVEHVGHPHCYNIGRSAKAPWRNAPPEICPMFGKKLPESAKQQLRKSALRQWQENDPRTGTIHTDETKVKIRAKARQAVAEGRGGRFIPSEETRRKMSEALKGNKCALGYKRTDAEREAIRQRTRGNQNWLGKQHTEKAKDKMRRPMVAIAPDGTETLYGGMTLVREALGITPTPLYNALRTGEPVKKGQFAGWKFRYA